MPLSNEETEFRWVDKGVEGDVDETSVEVWNGDRVFIMGGEGVIVPKDLMPLIYSLVIFEYPPNSLSFAGSSLNSMSVNLVTRRCLMILFQLQQYLLNHQQLVLILFLLLLMVCSLDNYIL